MGASRTYNVLLLPNRKVVDARCAKYLARGFQDRGEDMSLIRHKQDWDDLADIDPFWAILSYPEQKFGGWDIDKFFLTGDQEIERVMGFATQLGYPLGRELALDFGCGVGRLTRKSVV